MQFVKIKLLLIAVGLFLSGCSSIPFVPDREIVSRIFGLPPPRLEKRLESLGKDGYKQIIAFSRPDEKPFTEDDLNFLKTNSPPEKDSRLRRTDDSTFVAIGTNVPFTQTQLSNLQARFIYKDFSGKYPKPENTPSAAPTKSPANTNQAQVNAKTENVNRANAKTENANQASVKPENANAEANEKN